MIYEDYDIWGGTENLKSELLFIVKLHNFELPLKLNKMKFKSILGITN